MHRVSCIVLDPRHVITALPKEVNRLASAQDLTGEVFTDKRRHEVQPQHVPVCPQIKAVPSRRVRCRDEEVPERVVQFPLEHPLVDHLQHRDAYVAEDARDVCLAE